MLRGIKETKPKELIKKEVKDGIKCQSCGDKMESGFITERGYSMSSRVKNKAPVWYCYSCQSMLYRVES